MNGWNVQTYEMAPTVFRVTLFDWPFPIASVSKAPLSAVAVCSIESSFVKGHCLSLAGTQRGRPEDRPLATRKWSTA
jgi:hypothetical protein